MNKRVLSLALALLASPVFYARSAPFTYQAVLSDSGHPAQANYDLVFRIYNAETNGPLLPAPAFVENLPIASGHVAATLDFGEDIFNGQSRWLEIAVRRAGSPADYAPLLPRQLITAAPYAITALNLAGVNPLHIAEVGSSNLLNGTIQSPLLIQGNATGVGEIRVERGQVVFSGNDTSGDHHGTQLLLQAGDAMGPDKNGGNIVFVPGLPTGDGRGGRVVIDGAVKVTGLIAATALFADGSGIINLAASNLTGVLANQQLAGPYANAVQLVNVGNLFRGSFVGDGNGLSNLTASAFTGTLPMDSLAGTYAQVVNLTNSSNTVFGSFVGDGFGLSNLQAPQIAGTLSSRHIAGAYSNTVQLTSPSNQFAGAFSGDGTALTLSAAQLLGTLPNSALSGAYALALNLINPANNIRGAFNGNGGGLSNVNAITLQGLASGDFAQRGASNSFSAGQTFAGPVVFSNAVSVDGNLQVSAAVSAATLSGNGSAIRNLAASNVIGILGSAQVQGTYSNTVQFTSAANQFSG